MEMCPPSSVSTRAPIVPKSERERTVTPRTTPSDSTMSYPSSVNVVEVIASSIGSPCQEVKAQRVSARGAAG